MRGDASDKQSERRHWGWLQRDGDGDGDGDAQACTEEEG
jgi:hypothetical protein